MTKSPRETKTHADTSATQDSLEPLTTTSTLEPVPDSPQGLRRKLLQKRRRETRGRRLRRLSYLVLGTTAVVGGSWWWVAKTLPETPQIAQSTTVSRGTLTVQSADGGVVFQSGPATRQYLDIEAIPQWVQQAFIATEDRRFYQHPGVDGVGVVRAITSNLLSGRVTEGGSTLTQQLARISYLDQEQSILRKAREAQLALRIEQHLSKAEILERYLNQVYLGSGAYGVADAAWVYFGKSVAQLSLSETALLAGLPAAPSLYSPLESLERAEQRRREVLQRMVREGFITFAESVAAQSEPIQVNPQPPPNLDNRAPYFQAYIQKQLDELLPPEALQDGGLTVYTTLNLKWQAAATQAVQDTVALDGSAQGFEQAALVAIDPRNGEIKAMVGGANFNQSQFNRVTQAQRQPGSTFKAFVYAAAIASGLSPYDTFLDAPLVVDGYQPNNYGQEYRGWISMHRALSQSANIPAVRALIEVGFEPTINLARELGIQSKLDPFYATALGANELTLLELTSAYGTLAAQGVRTPTHGIRKVISREGEVLYQAPSPKKPALDPSSSAIMTWMLEQVVADGTGKPAQLGRPVAGKTGTSEESRDLWFVGFVPQLAAGVWLGNDNNTPTQGSSSTAAVAWKRFMAQIAPEIPVESFPSLPPLAGRKGSIVAQPVTPGSMYTLSMSAPTPEADPESFEAETSNGWDALDETRLELEY
ncbi:PBP1A family penicillin-binding protein [Synechococcales cyanobacterium C]|uniref:PBP1A family penicillin-binding protein n=1 Tax=Petrachloros mirabilis ULC683 TaxID=2781853 RepID=A0A8K2A817_9CYAN|nr:penicillin-binding protein 1A [Petrachloros mirabilis]NCJ06530.1 PBP1A family penicillin-binding protein [Petrachloros mirabilis ULC683]